MKVGILGGGLTGLTISAQLRLANEVLEKEDVCGGLCRSYQAGGFTFDSGGSHIIYSQNAKVLGYIRKILGANCAKHKRIHKIYFAGKLIKYPFEDNLDYPPFCIINNHLRPGNLKEWLYRTFGKKVAECYLIPYNRKIWKYPLEKMDFRWAMDRVFRPLPKNQPSLADFYYPLRGGIQSLIKSLENKTLGCVETGFRLKKIKRQKNKWIVSDGKSEKLFDKLISTIPVFDLIASLDNVPDSIKRALGRLRYNSLITVMIGSQQKKDLDYITLYFSQKEYLFHRLAFPGVYSRHNLPKDKFAVIAEITVSPDSAISRLTDRQISNRVVNDLHKLEIVDRRKICHQKVQRIKYAYVIHDRNYRQNIKIVKDFITAAGIEFCGRSAEFEYLNMDVCMDRAIKLADKLNRI